MPTQEERLITLEQSQTRFGEAINDLNHHVTMLVGIVQKQEWDIREMKSSLRSLEQKVQSLDGSVQSLRQDIQILERSMNSRLEGLDKKFDQILLLLNTLSGRPDET